MCPGTVRSPALASAIPSTCCKPTARTTVGGPRRNRLPTGSSSARGRPCGSPVGGLRDGAPTIPETCPPGEGMQLIRRIQAEYAVPRGDPRSGTSPSLTPPRRRSLAWAT